MRGQSGAIMLAALGAWLAVAGCSTTDSVPDCPFVVVAIDGGADAFSGVGVWSGGQVCSRFCDSSYTSCELLSETTVRCQVGCM